MSAGCTYKTVVSLYMREHQAILQPKVASASIDARPGAGRKTAYVYYSGLTKCQNYASYAFNWQSPLVRVCP